jgi:hypothetical protein
MAYVVDSTSTREDPATTTTITAKLPAHQAGDHLFAFFMKDDPTGGAWTTPTGYTNITSSASAGVNCSLWYKEATSSETNPSSGTSDPDEYIALMVSVRGLDGADLLNQPAVVATVTANRWQLPAVTTDEDDCLILYFTAVDQALKPTFESGAQYLASDFNSRCSALSGWTGQKSLGTSGRPYVWAAGNDGSVNIALALNTVDGAGGYCDLTSLPTEIVNPLIASDDSFWGGAAEDFTSILNTINGTSIAFNAYGTKSSGNVGKTFQNAQKLTQTAGMGGYVTNLTAYNDTATDVETDLTGKLVAMHMQIDDIDEVYQGQTLADINFMVGLRSNSKSALRIWKAAAKDSFPDTRGYFSVVFDPSSDVDCIATAGTWDITKVDGVFSGSHGKGQQVVLSSMCVALNTCVIVGGSSGQPAVTNSFYEAITSATVMTMEKQRGSSTKQFFALQGLQIGNGTEVTHFEDSGISLEFPKTASDEDKTCQYRVQANKIGLAIKGRAGDTIKFTDSLVSGETSWNLDLDITGGTSSFNGTTFNNCLVTNTTALALTDVIFRKCGTVPSNIDMSAGCHVSASVSTTGALVLTGSTANDLQALVDNLANCTLSKNPVAVLVDYTGTGDISLDFDNIRFTDNTVDLTYNSTNASQLTVVMEGVTNITAPKTAITGSATAVVLDAPSVSLVLNCTDETGAAANFATGTRIRVENVTTSTEIYNDVPGAVNTLSIPHVNRPAASVFQYKIISVDGATSATKMLKGTVDISDTTVSTNVTQKIDSVYEEISVDGSGISGISIAANKIDIDVNDSDNTLRLQDLYAWYVNYNVTEVGIRDSSFLIEARTSVLYEFDNSVEIKNTKTGSPLTIIGGNAADASGSSSGWIDTSGENIYIIPQSVVPFSFNTGTGLSAAQSAKIDAIDTAAALISSAADIAEAVWEEDISAATTGAGKTLKDVEDLNSGVDGLAAISAQIDNLPVPATVSDLIQPSAISDAVWAEDISAATSGAGKLLKDVDAVTAGTDGLVAISAQLDDVPTTSVLTPALIADAVWAEDISAATSGAGKALKDVDDVSAGTDGLVAISAQIDNLPTPALVSDLIQATTISDAVWNKDLSSANSGAGKALKDIDDVSSGTDGLVAISAQLDNIPTSSLNASSIADAVWAEDISAATSGAGKALKDIDDVSSGADGLVAISAQLDDVPTTSVLNTSLIADAVWSENISAATSGAGKALKDIDDVSSGVDGLVAISAQLDNVPTNLLTTTNIADAIWAEDLSGYTVGAGKLLKDVEAISRGSDGFAAISNQLDTLATVGDLITASAIADAVWVKDVSNSTTGVGKALNDVSVLALGSTGFSALSNQIGLLPTPALVSDLISASDIADAVWTEDLATYTTGSGKTLVEIKLNSANSIAVSV